MSTATHKSLNASVHIRWMIRRDMKEVLDIENECFQFKWTEDDFIKCLRQRNCIGMVAEYDEKVVGFMVYELHKDRLEVLDFAVSPWYQRAGVGTRMMAKLFGKLSYQRRCRILLAVRETNLDAQQFCKAMGFRAINVLHTFYEQAPEDAYLMEYRHSE